MMRFSWLVPAWTSAIFAGSAASALPPWERLRWTVRRVLHRLGRPGIVAVGVLAMCPAFYFSAVIPAQERLAAAHAKALSLQERATHSATAQGRGPQTAAEQLAEFYRVFPGEKSSPQWLEKLAALAESHGLSLDQGEYAPAPDKLDKLVRYQITLPLKGEYLQIRKFLSDLPVELPVVALESIQFQRQKIADPVVEARVRLVLYLGVEP
jgi:Tfp pilus assembly protein PilO